MDVKGLNNDGQGFFRDERGRVLTLGKKVSLISILIIAATILTYNGIFRFIVLSSFLELDAEHARQDTARCAAALAREIKHLNTFTHDWAS